MRYNREFSAHEESIVQEDLRNGGTPRSPSFFARAKNEGERDERVDGKMFGISTFDWSVGFGAWVAVVIGSLTVAEQTAERRRSAWATFAVALPLLSIGIVYTIARLFLTFVRLVLYIVFAMLQGEVLFTVGLCVALITGVQAALRVREATRRDPASASPLVLAAVRRVDWLLQKTQVFLLSVLVALMARGLASSTLVYILTTLESLLSEEPAAPPVAPVAEAPVAEATETTVTEAAVATEATEATEPVATEDATLTELITATLSFEGVTAALKED